MKAALAQPEPLGAFTNSEDRQLGLPVHGLPIPAPSHIGQSAGRRRRPCRHRQWRKCTHRSSTANQLPPSHLRSHRFAPLFLCGASCQLARNVGRNKRSAVPALRFATCRNCVLPVPAHFHFPAASLFMPWRGSCSRMVGSWISSSLASRRTLEITSAVRGSSSAKGRKSRPRCWAWTGKMHTDPPGMR